jgi:hypothetical protein
MQFSQQSQNFALGWDAKVISANVHPGKNVRTVPVALAAQMKTALA